jgi:hypothetical protein
MPDSRPKYFASLFPGAHYVGQQKSNHNSFEVEVEIKHVDLSDSFLCGYLRIEHLTEEFPVITTFFEADIIGEKYSFLTRKWDTNEEVDRKHWEKFEPFKQYSQVFNNEDFHYDFYNSQYIFMRWKVTVVQENKIKACLSFCVNKICLLSNIYCCFLCKIRNSFLFPTIA